MSLDRDLHVPHGEDRELLNQPVTSSSVSFVVPLALLIAAAMLGWIFYGSLSPTVDNTGSTTPVTQTDLPQSKPAAPTTP
jgi:hypothetical protein